MDYIRLGIYFAAMAISFTLGATMNGYRWEGKYNAREHELQIAVLAETQKVLATERAAESAKEQIVDGYEKRLFEINNRPPATRVIRVCGKPTSPLGVSTEDSPSSTDATGAVGGADQGNSGTVLDPEPVFAAAARCDAQLNALIEWAK